MFWALRGLRNGIVTTKYPDRPDSYADAFPAAVHPLVFGPSPEPIDNTLCPTRAIDDSDGVVRVGRPVGS